ncbi:ABC transporter ATP-binding protein [Clostridium perfringens]|nr:ABC transporter ATP-binding protein [Clostridium perfringens]
MYKQLIYFIKGQKIKIIFSVMLYYIFSFLNALSPIITKNFIDLIIGTSSKSNLKYFITFYLVIIILLALTGVISNYIAIKSFQEVKFNIRYNLYKKMYNIEPNFLNNTPSGEISYRILNNTNSIEQLLNIILLAFPIDIITIITLGIISMKWNWKLSIFIFIILLIQILIINKFKNKASKYYDIQQKNNQFLSGLVTETLSDIEFIKGINMDKYINSKIYKNMDYLKTINIKVTNLLAISSILSILINNIWTLIVLWYGGSMVIDGKMSIGTLMAFLMIFGMIYPKMISIFNNLINFQNLKVSFNRVVEYYNLKEISNNENIEKFKFNKGEILIENLEFGYTNDKPIFNKFNAIFKPYSVTALTGVNGAGKTTLCKLISRIINPKNGRVLIDNVNINDIDEEYLRENIIYQPQDKFLINGTILENIVCNKEINHEKINEILEKVGLTEFIDSLPNKLNTEVLNNNNILSLGQAQKIALARIYYNTPKIIILDEPTSFSDKFGIDLFNNTIQEMKENSTIIVVAHNEKTINKSDYIISL